MAKGRTILVVGAGGREHALAWRLLDCESVNEVIVSPGNAGTARPPRATAAGKVLRNVPGSPVEVARSTGADLVVVGPEAPLCSGLVDELQASGIAAFGPTQAAARLEGSKAFMKGFVERHGILSARHATVTHPDEAARAIADFPEPPVVKADGLCAGKGVVVSESHDQALQVVRAMLSGESFGDAGRTVVIEERVTGAEASVHAICDGQRHFLLPPSQDHKRIGDGDTGPNTGGMGAYAPAPLVTPDLERRIQTEVIERTLVGMQQEGIPYQGTLYAGLMITAQGDPYVLEFNVRFGDPETQVLMDVLDGDLAEALDGAAHGQLAPGVLRSSARHALCVVLAAAGYPGSPRKGDRIDGLARAETLPKVRVYHAGTKLDSERLVTSGGRVLGVTGQGATLAQAHARAYQAAELIRFAGKQHRSDIGSRALGAAG